MEYLKSIDKDELNQNFNSILDIFSLIEFEWGMTTHEKRKYFYNKYVVLFYIAKRLRLKTKLRTLKDTERVNEQVTELDGLLNNSEMLN